MPTVPQTSLKKDAIGVPATTVAGWFSGLSIAALVLLFALTSLAIAVHRHRHWAEANRWTTLLAAIPVFVTLGGTTAGRRSTVQADGILQLV